MYTQKGYAENESIQSTHTTPTVLSNSADIPSDWSALQMNHPFGIPTRRSDEIYRKYTPQMSDAFRRTQAMGPCTVPSTARPLQYCHPQYGPFGTAGELNTFDAFYSDVFLSDFQNVDPSQYNVGITMGGWYRHPRTARHPSHIHQTSLSTASTFSIHPVSPANDPATHSRHSPCPYPQLPPPLTAFTGLESVETSPQKNLMEAQESGKHVHTMESLDLEDVELGGHQDNGLGGQQAQILKRLLSDEPDGYIRTESTKDHDVEGPQCSREDQESSELMSAGQIKDYGAHSVEYPQVRRGDQESSSHDLGLDLQINNGDIRVLKIHDLQQLKREELEILEKELREHQHMWDMEGDLKGQTFGKEVNGHQIDKHVNEQYMEEELHEPRCEGKSSQVKLLTESSTLNLNPDGAHSTKEYTNALRTGLQESDCFVLYTAESSYQQQPENLEFLTSGHSSEMKHRTSSSLKNDVEHPWFERKSATPELNECAETVSAAASNPVARDSAYTVIRTRPEDVVTSSLDTCSGKDLLLSELNHTQILNAEVNTSDTELTGYDYVSSTTTGSGEKKRRRREVQRAVDEPRRPKNGFIRFSIEYRHKIAAQRPKLDNRDISRILGCKWRKMTAEEKKCYEEEFEKDIQSIREEHPEWRYAPAKRLSEELIEPMPSRLRPRNNLKRKFPYMVRTYTRRSSEPGKKKNTKIPKPMSSNCNPGQRRGKNARYPQSAPLLTTTWVQCDLCGKWRCVPVSAAREDPRDVWFCYFNPDLQHNSCSDSEDIAEVKSPRSPSPCSPTTSTSTPSPSYSTYSNSKAHVLFREPTW